MRVEFLAADTGHKTEAWLRQEEEGHAQMRNSICNHLDQSEQQKKCRRTCTCSLSLSTARSSANVDVAFRFRSASSSLFGSLFTHSANSARFSSDFSHSALANEYAAWQERLTEAPIDRNYASGKVFSLRLEPGCIQLAACVPAENTR